MTVQKLTKLIGIICIETSICVEVCVAQIHLRMLVARQLAQERRSNSLNRYCDRFSLT